MTTGRTGPKATIPTLYELSVRGRHGVDLPAADVPEAALPPGELGADCDLPELSQLEVVRHFLALSQRNFGVDTGFYPLGSCTMKYNPKVNEQIARLAGFAADPSAAGSRVRSGQSRIDVQPAAMAGGDRRLRRRLAAALGRRAWRVHRPLDDARLSPRPRRGERTRILIPDSAHGTNPASTTMAGFTAVELPSDARGNVDIDAVRAACDRTVAGIMMTNPNTLGLFEEHIEEVVRLVRECGGLIYGDGANMNALAGIARPGDLGFDVMHFNLHKTFSTPHGGGGPGAGPVGVSARLADFLPGPVIEAVRGERGEVSYHPATPKKSIGQVSTFFGNFGMFVRAYAYIRRHGGEGLRANSEHAVLNANYLRIKLRDTFRVPYDRMNMHEFVCQGTVESTGMRALDISKRLLDYGLHPPTNYFPLIVPEALMIEPTETESKPTLDAFVEAMQAIAAEAHTDPALVKGAPHDTPVRRLDEVRAARQLVLSDRAKAAGE